MTEHVHADICAFITDEKPCDCRMLPSDLEILRAWRAGELKVISDGKEAK